jgi:hypothetical protein
VGKVQQVEKVEAFCPSYDRITVTEHPNEPAKVRKGAFKKGDLVVFDADVARHVYRGVYFFGKVYTTREWAIDNPKQGMQVETMSDDDFWGLRKGY